MLKNQKGMALIIAFITILIASFIASVFTYTIVHELYNTRKDRALTSALFIARAGANKAIRQLQKDIDTDFSDSLLDGTYTVDIDDSTKLITSTGTVHGREQIVKIAYGLSSSSGGADLAFDYAVFTDGKQWYQGGGNPHIPIVVYGDVHSNNVDDPTGQPWPDINNPSHHIVDEDDYEISQGPPSIDFPSLDVRYDSTDSNLHYYDDDFEISNDYWHTATNGDSDNHYYHDFEDTKTSPSQSANWDSSPVLPTDGGVTLIISNATPPPTVSIGSGAATYTGTLIIIGANATISGNITFNGLIYVEESNSNNGGDLIISGSPDVYGAIIARTVDAGSGTPSVYYTPSNFKDGTKTGGKEGSLDIYSWQAEY